jgi:hypothetical protein
LTAGVCWPEFKGAGEWRDYAMSFMSRSIQEQVHPDGAQKELTTTYHCVTLTRLQYFMELLKNAGRDVPPEMEANELLMLDYLAKVIRPDGNGPLNNDSDTLDMREKLLAAADKYEREDWRYVATGGAEGLRPDDPPSRFMPWAGQVVMRSDWTPDSDWAFFDIGPFGTGHQHSDKLHLSVHVKGRPVLVDAGRYTYKNVADRHHVRGTESHNTVMPVGARQNGYEHEYDQPVETCSITEDSVSALGVFDAGYEETEGLARHTRAVEWGKQRWWLVVDRFETDRPRSIEAFWHFHPDCTVQTNGLQVMSVDASVGNALVVPAGPVDWKLEMIKGQREPHLQGWFSERYNSFVPAPCARYSADIQETAVFAWLIVPSVGPCEAPPELSIEVEDTEAVRATIQSASGAEHVEVRLDAAD